MSKYKRKTPLISPIKMAVAALCAAIAAIMGVIFSGTDNEWYIICGGIAVTLFFCDMFIVAGAAGQYGCSDKCIYLMYPPFTYKKLYYSDFNAVVISNASYNNGYGYGVNGNMPMQYKVKGTDGYTKVTYPFITLHTPQYPVNKIQERMNSRDLFFADSENIFCLGICWFDALSELLTHTDMPVYVLEDVYLRFRGKFDSIFAQHETNIDRFYIITDHKIEYKKYLKG